MWMRTRMAMGGSMRRSRRWRLMAKVDDHAACGIARTLVKEKRERRELGTEPLCDLLLWSELPLSLPLLALFTLHSFQRSASTALTLPGQRTALDPGVSLTGWDAGGQRRCM